MKTLITTITVLAFASTSHAASFDCSKAFSLVEKTICSESQLSELDNLLMKSYKKAMTNSIDKGLLKSDQKNWLANVRNKCQDSICLSRVYKDRISTLNNSVAVSDIASKEGVSGSYTYIEKGFYGTMVVSEISECEIYPRKLGCLASKVLTAKIYSAHEISGHDCDIDAIENKSARITHNTLTEVTFLAKDKSDDINFSVIFTPKGADISSGNIFNGCGIQGSILGHWQREL